MKYPITMLSLSTPLHWQIEIFYPSNRFGYNQPLPRSLVSDEMMAGNVTSYSKSMYSLTKVYLPLSKNRFVYHWFVCVEFVYQEVQM